MPMEPWNPVQRLEAGRGLAESLGQDGGGQAGLGEGLRNPFLRFRSQSSCQHHQGQDKAREPHTYRLLLEARRSRWAVHVL